MRTQLQRGASLLNFNSKVGRFLSYGTVVLENEAQVNFFLKIVTSTFGVNVRVWSFSGMAIEVIPDYTAGRVTARASTYDSGWIVGIPSLGRDDIEKVIELDDFDFGEHRVVNGVVTNILVDDSGQEVQEEA